MVPLSFAQSCQTICLILIFDLHACSLRIGLHILIAVPSVLLELFRVSCMSMFLLFFVIRLISATYVYKFDLFMSMPLETRDINISIIITATVLFSLLTRATDPHNIWSFLSAYLRLNFLNGQQH